MQRQAVFHSREAALTALVTDNDNSVTSASYNVTQTVPITERCVTRGIVEFTLPRDCDLIENVLCSRPKWTIYLRGAGADKISLKKLQIWMANALYSNMVVVVKIPEGESATDLDISYKCTIYDSRSRTSIFLKNTSIASRICTIASDDPICS